MHKENKFFAESKPSNMEGTITQNKHLSQQQRINLQLEPQIDSCIFVIDDKYESMLSNADQNHNVYSFAENITDPSTLAVYEN